MPSGAGGCLDNPDQIATPARTRTPPFETEVGQERWSVFAGPSLHYGSAKWWATFTYLPQLEGGGEQYGDQPGTSLHLIEKTKQELRLKLGFNF